MSKLDRVIEEVGARRAKGALVLFVGAKDSGKARAAKRLAEAADAPLTKFSFAVVSKYIGETEKNLNKILNTAAQTGAVLLFDEADALFGKRTDVRDSHDRYANLDVNRLMEMLEQHPGIVILAANRSDDIETPWRKRCGWVIDFPPR